MVNTANNHSMDFYESGYRDSLAALDEAGVGRFGSLSLNDDTLYDVRAVEEVEGIRIGFIGFSYPQPADADRLALAIGKLRDDLACSLVVVSLHWGRETIMTPGVWQTRLAKSLIDAGADVIYGHHPHVIQPIQFYRGKPIFYSTGNFTFGTMSHVDPSTGIFQLRYRLEDDEPVLEELRVVPCQTQRNPDFRPFELTDAVKRQDVFEKLVMNTAQEGFENSPGIFRADRRCEDRKRSHYSIRCPGKAPKPAVAGLPSECRGIKGAGLELLTLLCYNKHNKNNPCKA